MAHDLTQFLRPLAVDPEPGLSPIDTRLNTITDLAEQRKFSAAAELSGQLLDEQIYDIRPISIYLLGAFLDDGLGALGGVFDALGALLGPNLAAVGPTKRREEQFARRLAWLFDTVMDLLKYHQAKRSPEWERWGQGASAEVVAAALASGEALGRSLSAEVFTGAHHALLRVMGWLREHGAQLSVAAPAPVTVAPSVAPPSAAAPAPAPARPAGRGAEAPADPLEPVRRRVELEVSHRFIELWVKLRAFEALIEKKQFARAALVNSDILETIERFDPRDYFPEVFARFSSLSSRHVGPLGDHAVNPDSDEGKALAQFYRVDIKGFVDGLPGWTACRRPSSSPSRGASRARRGASTCGRC